VQVARHVVTSTLSIDTRAMRSGDQTVAICLWERGLACHTADRIFAALAEGRLTLLNALVITRGHA
jgi:hypothetical protein